MTTDTTGPRPERRSFGRIFSIARSRFWRVRYRVGAREFTESSGSTDHRVAERLLARREAEFGLGTFTGPDVRRTTFEDLLQMIRDDYRARRRRSTKRLEGSITHLTVMFAGQRACTITADRLTRYVADRLEAGAAPPTIRNELNALRHAFRLALRAEKVAKVPAFPALAPARIRTGFFEEADFQRVLAELPDYLRPAMQFAYITGWRMPSEVLCLTWSHIDFAAGVVRLEPGQSKNGEGRTFPFDVMPRLGDLLRTQRDRSRALQRRLGRIVQPVFWRDDGIRLADYYSAWHSACARAARDAQGAIVRPHLLDGERIPYDFRRTAVRNLVRAGVPEKTAMLLTGHKTRAVFDRYDIINEADLRTAVRKLAAYTAAQAAPERVAGQDS